MEVELLDIRIFAAIIIIIKADDIVFTKIFSTLNLNNHERYLARIFEAMVLADRNKGRLINVNNLLAVTARNKGSAGYHDPVFTAMMVFLQRQALTGQDFNTLYFIIRVLIENGIGAPRAFTTFHR